MYKLNRVFAAALLLFAAGCGGGGGDDVGGVIEEPLVADFQGPYQVIGAFGQESTPDRMQAIHGSALSDGAGTLDLSLTTNNGVVLGVGSVPLEYAIEPDQDLRLSSAGLLIHEGGIAPDGSAAVAGAADGFPETATIVMLQRPTAPFEPALLGGIYHSVSMAQNPQQANHTGLRQMWDFKPDGTVTFLAGGTSNNNGVVTSTTVPVDFTYAVQPNGTLSIAFGANSQTVGSIDQNGDVAIMGGTVPSGAPRMDAMVRASVGATNGVLQGEYFMVSFTADLNNYVSRTGRIQFDGNGGAFGTLRRSAGTISPIAEVEGINYLVSADGSLTLFYQGRSTTLVGAVSPDGRYAILGGATTGRPTFEFLIRKDAPQS